MAQDTFSDAQQREFSTNLIEHLRADNSAKEIFCKCWPCAKQVLELILGIPALPPIVSTIVKAAIKAGDAAHNAVCK